MDVQTELARVDGELIHEGRREWHHGKRARVHTQQEMQHGHIADHDRLVCLHGRDPGVAVELRED